MGKIKLTKKNIDTINCNDVALFSFSEAGSAFKSGNICIITFNKKVYVGNYLFGDLTLENYLYVLPALSTFSYSFNKITKLDKHWKSLSLGLGNYLIIRKEIFNSFKKFINNKNSNKIISYKNWIKYADEFLTDVDIKNLSTIKPLEENRLNPFFSMGFNIDINNRNIQKDIISYVENNSTYILSGYNFHCLNAYSNNIQIFKEEDSVDLTLSEKMDNLIIHHTNNNVWKCEITTSLDKYNEFIIEPCCNNRRGAAIIKLLNTDIKPYLREKDKIFFQVCCFAYDLRVFHNKQKDNRTDKNIHFYLDRNDSPIYLSDNSIILASITNDQQYEKLNFVRGPVIDIICTESNFLGKKSKYYVLVLDTEFGKAPVICSNNVISYNSTSKINIGDVVEAICSISGDMMLFPKDARAIYDKEHLFDIVRRAFESKKMCLLNNVLTDDCKFKSDRHTFTGKNNVISSLQYITDRGYKDHDVKLYYGEICENPVPNFKILDEVLCVSFDGNIEGKINIRVNKDNLISNIYLTNDKNIRFKIYSDNGKIPLDPIDKKIFVSLAKKLKKKRVPEVSIHSIPLFCYNNSSIAEKLINFIDSSDTKGKELVSDILSYQHKLITNYDRKHPHRKTLKLNDYDDYDYTPLSVKIKSVYNISYRKNNDSDKILEVSNNPSLIGSLNILRHSSINFVESNLDLAFCSLKDLDNDARNNLDKINLYKEFGNDYSFKDTAKSLENDLSYYDEIRIWSSHDNPNAYLLPYYFINRFRKYLENTKITIVFIDALKNRKNLDDLLIGEFDKLLETSIRLTKKQILNYSNMWDKIKEVECDIRTISNDTIEYKYIEDYFDLIYSFIPKKTYIKRCKLIGQLITDNQISPDMCSYIIDEMIRKNILISTDYEIPNVIPNDKISRNKDYSID